MGFGEVAAALVQTLAHQVHGAGIGLFGCGGRGFAQVIELGPLVPGGGIQRQDVIHTAALGAVVAVDPAGQNVHSGEGNGAIGIPGEGEGEEHTVLGVGGGAGINQALALVGHGVAQGVQAHGLVAFVLGAGQQVDGLDHMGMAADNDINAQIAQALGHGGLLVIGLQLVLFAPMDEHDVGFGTLGLHGLHVGGDFGVEAFQVVIAEGVYQAVGVLVGGDAVDDGVAVLVKGGVGVAHHADLDAVDFYDGVVGLVFRGNSAQGVQADFPDGGDGAGDALEAGVVAMVIGSQQHIEAGVQSAGGQGIRGIELGIAAVLHFGAPEGGFQIGHGIVGGLDVGSDIGPDIFVVVAAVILEAGVADALMGQDIAGGADGGSGYHVQGDRFRLGGSGGGFGGGLRGRVGSGIGGAGGSRAAQMAVGGGGVQQTIQETAAPQEPNAAGGQGQDQQDDDQKNWGFLFGCFKFSSHKGASFSF